MNVPLGTQTLGGKELSEEIVRDIISFMDSNKTGYFCVTTEGDAGIEDALLVIDSGNVVGAHYNYLAFDTEYTAGEALKRIVNCFLAPKGVYDAYTLTSQQLELLKIFNENTLLLERIPLRSFEGMVPVTYSKDFGGQELQSVPEDREEVLKKHGIGEIKVDNFAEIKAETEAIQPKLPNSTDKVAGEVETYLKSGSLAPTTSTTPAVEPIPAPVIATPEELEKPPEVVEVKTKAVIEPQPIEETMEEETSEELEALDAQAEKLRKLLLKEKD